MCRILSNKEAIKLLKEIASGREDAIEQGYLPIVSKYYDAFDMAIKALEQEPILDKIRAEIEKLNPVDYGSMFSYESHNGAKYMKDDILCIIDRYGK